MLKYAASVAFGVLVTLLILGIWYLNNRQDLDVWHTVDLDEEFTARSDVETLPRYLELEERLFRQLDEKVYAVTDSEQKQVYNRYHRDSHASPDQWQYNWNRTFVLDQDESSAGVLLLHGMSDSPYSLRTIGHTLHSAGAYVVGLRLPGHGTAPSGLTDLSTQDMIAAVRLAAIHVREEIGDRPMYVIGYSNGGALATHYVLKSLDDTELPQLAGLVLVSPSIGVTGAARFAIWQARLGRWLGMPKLEWQSILFEYDPFKYGAFAVNAGDVVFQLTRKISALLAAAERNGVTGQLPPILAFQSIVDATVSTPALAQGLFNKLPEGPNELVVFDIDRTDQIEPLLAGDFRPEVLTSIAGMDQPFTMTVLSNTSGHSQEVSVYRSRPGSPEVESMPLGLSWPDDVFSLAHVALLNPASDPLYGAERPAESENIYLGRIDLRGERGLFRIPAAEMLRQRWNPFYSYVERRILDFMKLPGCDAESQTICAVTSPPDPSAGRHE